MPSNVTDDASTINGTTDTVSEWSYAPTITGRETTARPLVRKDPKPTQAVVPSLPMPPSPKTPWNPELCEYA